MVKTTLSFLTKINSVNYDFSNNPSNQTLEGFSFKNKSMNPQIQNTIQPFSAALITSERKAQLQPLIDFIQQKKNSQQTIRLNFICTHNSRRSHLSEIWAQAMAFHFGLKNVFCYSGGTEATAMFWKVHQTLAAQGFEVMQLSESANPVFAIKYAPNESAIICFSKIYHHDFNPKGDYAAIMTCDHADEGCPVVLGAAARFAVRYQDPKQYDNTPLMDDKYAERSLEIGQEMWYIFSQIN